MLISHLCRKEVCFKFKSLYFNGLILIKLNLKTLIFSNLQWLNFLYSESNSDSWNTLPQQVVWHRIKGGSADKADLLDLKVLFGQQSAEGGGDHVLEAYKVLVKPMVVFMQPWSAAASN